jgi:hypothetical protein
MWLDDNYNEKGSRDMILVVVVAIVTYFFTVYLQQVRGMVQAFQHFSSFRLAYWASLCGHRHTSPYLDLPYGAVRSTLGHLRSICSSGHV